MGLKIWVSQELLLQIWWKGSCYSLKAAKHRVLNKEIFIVVLLCIFVTSQPVRICFGLKKARPWSEFRINFKQYSTRSFQRALVGFNKLWIHFIFILFNCVSMIKTRSPPLHMESWARTWEVVFFLFQRKLYILFSISFLIYFWIVQTWPMYHNLENRIWFTIILLPLKEGLTLFQIWLFCYIFTYFVPFRVIENSVTKINFKYFNGNCVTVPVVPVDQFYFYMHQPRKPLLFEIIIFLCFFK